MVPFILPFLGFEPMPIETHLRAIGAEGYRGDDPSGMGALLKEITEYENECREADPFYDLPFQADGMEPYTLPNATEEIDWTHLQCVDLEEEEGILLPDFEVEPGESIFETDDPALEDNSEVFDLFGDVGYAVPDPSPTPARVLIHDPNYSFDDQWWTDDGVEFIHWKRCEGPVDLAPEDLELVLEDEIECDEDISDLPTVIRYQ